MSHFLTDSVGPSRFLPLDRRRKAGRCEKAKALIDPLRSAPSGEHEMLRDDSIRVAQKALADGASVRLEVWPGMFHVFQSHDPLLPEARAAIEHIVEIMRSRPNSF